MRFYGHTDVGLSPLGVRQADCLAECLREAPLAAVYTSDLRRSLDTASRVAAVHGLKPIVEAAFREIGMGRWDGRTAQEIRHREPELAARWFRASGSLPFPEGEGLDGFHARVLSALREIGSANRGRTIALVGHGGTNRVILSAALGAPASRLYAMRQDFAALNLIEYDEDEATVVRMNDRCHLRHLDAAESPSWQ